MTALFIASTGGHLTQLYRLRPRITALDPSDDLWVTFDTPQSRSLLHGKKVAFVRYTHPRDLRSTVVNTRSAVKIVRQHRPSHAISTGAAVAVSFLPVAATFGASCHYIESATRTAAPSMTGRILQRVPCMNLYTQYKSWSSDRWRYQGSVLDGFSIAPSPKPYEPKKIVVSLGQLEKYGFRRLVERLVNVLPKSADIIWQTGATDVSGLSVNGLKSIPASELRTMVQESDVVISHAGTGAALLALEAGKYPVLVPRRSSFGEHVDDHQVQIAHELSARGLALCREVNDLSYEDVLNASRYRALVPDSIPVYTLGGTGCVSIPCQPHDQRVPHEKEHAG